MLVALIGLCLCGGVGAQGDGASQVRVEQLSHGRFEHVAVYRGTARTRSFVLLLSDAAGWDAAADRLARALALRGALVAGIDTRAFFAVMERDGGDCEFSDGDLENLSHFVQAYYRVPGYLPPLLVGAGAGGSFAYANLAQAPAGTFGGALALDFCPRLPLRKPLCGGSGLRFKSTGAGVELLPAPGLAAPLTALPPPAGGACAAADLQAFAAGVPGSRLLPPAAADGSDAQALQAFDALAQAQPAPAVPPPGSLGDLPLVEVPAAAGTAPNDVFAVLLSGDGGWAGLDKEVAAALAARGIPVVGLDSLRYFWSARTPAGTAADLDRVIRHYLANWNKRGVLLVGYSQGADVLPFILNRLPAATRAQVLLAAAMGLSEQAVFEFHLGNWMGGTTGPSQPTLPEVQRLSGVPFLCIYGADESDSLCPQLNPAQVRLVKLEGGHHFGGDYGRLAQEILSAAGLPATQLAQSAATPAGGSTDQSETPMMLHMHVAIAPLLALIAGFLILVQPKLLNYVVAIYLILVGVLGLVHLPY